MRKIILSALLMFYALPGTACESDQALLSSKLGEDSLKYYAELYESQFTIDEPSMTPEAAVAMIQPKDEETCLMQATQRQIKAILQSSINRHDPISVGGFTYFDRHPANKDVGGSFGISMQIYGKKPFVRDFYQWDGSRFKYIKREYYDN